MSHPTPQTTSQDSLTRPLMTALASLLNHYRQSSMSEREKGTYFEELMLCYLRNEATYRDLYSDVWTYGEWAALQGLDKRDAGIDLVAKTQVLNHEQN